MLLEGSGSRSVCDTPRFAFYVGFPDEREPQLVARDAKSALRTFPICWMRVQVLAIASDFMIFCEGIGVDYLRLHG